MTYLMPNHHRQRSETSQLKKSTFCLKWKSAVLLLVTASMLLLAVLGIVTWKFILPSNSSTTSGSGASHFGENIKIIETEQLDGTCGNTQLGKYFYSKTFKNINSIIFFSRTQI